MHVFPLVIALSALSGFLSARNDKILLSSIQVLILRDGHQTTHRREPARPQVRRLTQLQKEKLMLCFTN